jgi:hypothetical protein
MAAKTTALPESALTIPVYAAFVVDPDGNNIEAVFHGEASRSSASVVITF